LCGERGPEAFCYKLNQFSEESFSFARVLLRGSVERDPRGGVAFEERDPRGGELLSFVSL